jgi:hypothetical protein
MEIHQDYAANEIPYCPVCLDSWHSNNEGVFFCPQCRSDCPLAPVVETVEVSGLVEEICNTDQLNDKEIKLNGKH